MSDADTKRDVTARFFVVWCPESSKPVQRKFATLGQAIHVRDSLSDRYPDRTFHILGNVPEDIVEAFTGEECDNPHNH